MIQKVRYSNFLGLCFFFFYALDGGGGVGGKAAEAEGKGDVRAVAIGNQ